MFVLEAEKQVSGNACLGPGFLENRFNVKSLHSGGAKLGSGGEAGRGGQTRQMQSHAFWGCFLISLGKRRSGLTRGICSVW